MSTARALRYHRPTRRHRPARPGRRARPATYRAGDAPRVQSDRTGSIDSRERSLASWAGGGGKVESTARCPVQYYRASVDQATRHIAPRCPPMLNRECSISSRSSSSSSSGRPVGHRHRDGRKPPTIDCSASSRCCCTPDDCESAVIDDR